MSHERKGDPSQVQLPDVRGRGAHVAYHVRPEATVNQALDVGGEVEVVDEQRQDRRDT
jgi:hypothetical protein